MAATPEEKLIVINLFGGPGVGKSKIRAGLFSLMKDAGINCEETTEYAKDVTWEGNISKLSDVLYILAKQNRKLERLRGKVSVVVTDSPLLLCLNYAPINYFPKNFQKLTWEVWDSYRNINFYLRRSGPYNPVGRNQTEDEAKEIDKVIAGFLTDHNLPCPVLDSNRETALEIFNSVEKLLPRLPR